MKKVNLDPVLSRPNADFRLNSNIFKPVKLKRAGDPLLFFLEFIQAVFGHNICKFKENMITTSMIIMVQHLKKSAFMPNARYVRIV